MYHHEFTIEGEALTGSPMFEERAFTLEFNMDSEHDINDFDVTKIDGEPVSELELQFIETAEGYAPFWDRVEDACKDERDALVTSWAEDAAYAKAEQQYNARHADDDRMADMGMDVPVR